ncbi:hypothetical protein J8E27_00045 [Brucella sp. 458]|uniref:hypothetical protein n=1 Tax=Brucella sp. 458 TaxID=2821140 RepID=UPI001ADF172F|nr:hypothetical protein [Brucella sp. 458]QTN98575.1 hypothetical protein J8E27_00045 [Brucella sp. 458]
MKQHCVIETEDIGRGKVRLHFHIDIQIGQLQPLPREIIDDAFTYLRHLLMFKPDGETPVRRMIESALNDNEDSRLLLRLAGIRVVSDFATNEGFIVASAGVGVNRLFDGSAWGEGLHRHALSSLPGARPTGPLNFAEGKAFRGTFLPARLIYDAMHY